MNSPKDNIGHNTQTTKKMSKSDPQKIPVYYKIPSCNSYSIPVIVVLVMETKNKKTKQKRVRQKINIPGDNRRLFVAMT